jgi:hypothetical protein
MKCIYCLEDKPKSFFKKTEHVLPQSFGKFKNNLTLNKIVCDECNEYFGNHLEISLGRDTLEGMSRFEHKVKNKHEFKSPGKESRINIKVDEGPCRGAYAYREYSDSEDKIIIKPIPQVGFKMIDGADYVYFPLDEIPDKQYLDKHFVLNVPKSITVLGCTSKDAQKHLSEKNITLSTNPTGEFSYSEKPFDWGCVVTGKIDQTIFRSIAKIAFNYLSYWAGRDIVVDRPFNPIRRYIRFGEETSFPFVVIIEKAIMFDEPMEGKRRLGHIITLDWSDSKLSITSNVSLFNFNNYSVLLAKDYKGKSFNLPKGNFFNIYGNEILEISPRDMK